MMLEGKVIVITGAATGIGRESAVEFGRAGARVLLADIKVDEGEAAAEAVRSAGGVAQFVETDVASESAVKAMVAFALETFGRLDGAFNNAGMEERLVPITDIERADYDHVLGVNLHGVFFCLKHEIAAMKRTGGGAIVNCASAGSGETAVPDTAAYTAAKHGCIGLTRAASSEARATGVRVNAVLPGVTMTPMVEQLSKLDAFKHAVSANALAERHSIGRFGTPIDVARAAKWLLSDEAAFINGAMLPVDGGLMARA